MMTWWIAVWLLGVVLCLEFLRRAGSLKEKRATNSVDTRPKVCARTPDSHDNALTNMERSHE